MNLRTFGALFLLLASVNSSPFYEIKDKLLIGEQTIDMQAYDPESPFNGDFVKKGDIYQVRNGLLCFADSFDEYASKCFKNITNSAESWVRLYTVSFSYSLSFKSMISC